MCFFIIRLQVTITYIVRSDLTEQSSARFLKNDISFRHPLRFYQQNSDTSVNCPGLSWSERFIVRSYVVRGLVFHCT
jgi:hypothetical protein